MAKWWQNLLFACHFQGMESALSLQQFPGNLSTFAENPKYHTLNIHVHLCEAC